MTDLEIYIDGFNDKGIQIANAFLDVMRYKLNKLGADSTDVFTKIFDTSKQATEHYPHVACFIYDYFHYKV